MPSYRYGCLLTHTLGENRHLNIGAGRIVWQDIVRIDQSIKKRQFHKSPKIVEAMDHAKEGNGRLHLLGLVSRLDRFRVSTFRFGMIRTGAVGPQPRSELSGLTGMGLRFPSVLFISSTSLALDWVSSRVSLTPDLCEKPQNIPL